MKDKDFDLNPLDEEEFENAEDLEESYKIKRKRVRGSKARIADEQPNEQRLNKNDWQKRNS